MTSSLPNLDAFRQLLALELAAIDSPRLRTFAQSVMIEPTLKTLCWEYGEGEEFPSWLFADFEERDVGAAYCCGGHGALGHPWGLVFIHDDWFGMDSGWYPSLQALIEDWVPGS